jgi:hypothetical protein
MSEPSDRIGTELLFENDRVRVWDMVLEPGEASSCTATRTTTSSST